MVVPLGTATLRPLRSSSVAPGLASFLRTTICWPVRENGTMSMISSRSGRMNSSCISASHCCACSAATKPGNLSCTQVTLRPMRAAISVPSSTSKPMGCCFSSK